MLQITVMYLSINIGWFMYKLILFNKFDTRDQTYVNYDTSLN